jgi:hypothetical protein
MSRLSGGWLTRIAHPRLLARVASGLVNLDGKRQHTIYGALNAGVAVVWVSDDLNAINSSTYSARMRQRDEDERTARQRDAAYRSLPSPLVFSASVTRPAMPVKMPRLSKPSMPHLRLKTGRARTREELQTWCFWLEEYPNLVRPGFSIEVTGECGEKIGKAYQEYFRCLAELEKLRASNAGALPDFISISTDALSKVLKAASTLYSNNLLAELARLQTVMVDDRKIVEGLLRLGFECIERGGGVTRLQIRPGLLSRLRIR